MTSVAKMRSLWIAATSAWLLLAQPCGVPASASEHASTARTSRWWKLSCHAATRSRDDELPPCMLTVRLRGRIESSHLRLLQEALRRRDDSRRALGRPVAIHVDVDSRGGQVFASMEIGRLLRHETASISVAQGASCISACVFMLMGAPERSVARGARVGIHRLSIEEAGGDALVDAMLAQIHWYAEQMNVSPAIVADMMSIPAERVRFLTSAELDHYGIRVSETK
jgi:ATP-dependent protease ClpP protease subunit